MATKEKKKKVSRVVKGQELEVEHLTEIADVSPRQARALLRSTVPIGPSSKTKPKVSRKRTEMSRRGSLPLRPLRSG
ncbi:hypothetical protein [Mesorhizobium sp. M1A.F.Ca.ET.072.01.1.1]|uniref:hypothetical protein n=1 Tax=Mesorhizobium sp. M1A.F.Ca.ET.072.01.1.1 TaxID=2496753 RepID=UPI001FE111C2|nr:hypothetical protein [Mesorhizobium sp. M1A.F.Ca.ET.072.01.1.1]